MGFATPKCAECGKPSLRWRKVDLERFLCANASCGTLILGADVVARFTRVRDALARQRGSPLAEAIIADAAAAFADDGPHDEKDALWGHR